MSTVDVDAVGRRRVQLLAEGAVPVVDGNVVAEVIDEAARAFLGTAGGADHRRRPERARDASGRDPHRARRARDEDHVALPDRRDQLEPDVGREPGDAEHTQVGLRGCCPRVKHANGRRVHRRVFAPAEVVEDDDAPTGIEGALDSTTVPTAPPSIGAPTAKGGR